MCCPCCFIPSITVKLLGTSAALLYGQRYLFKDGSGSKWARRISLFITILISLVLSALGIFLFALASNDGYRSRFFSNICMMQNSKPADAPMNVLRCSILDEGNVNGHVLEFGPGPGTNFKCFENSTSTKIDRYVAVEPNPFFEEGMRKEKEHRGLDFPLEVVGLKGEDVAIDDSDKFDVVILTHVLCSVDSVEVVLANAEKALKPNGRMVFFEHVISNEQKYKYVQWVVAPMLKIVGNGCGFKDLRTEIESYLGDRFDYFIEDFEAPMPLAMYFVRPHIKGVATKK